MGITCEQKTVHFAVPWITRVSKIERSTFNLTIGHNFRLNDTTISFCVKMVVNDRLLLNHDLSSFRLINGGLSPI